ncbi:drug resistance transporter EmrB/QacA subfamily [Colletotrichum scovillei]|uniref:Drug resistance transporter EmrB/QacA subfamily n=1 Tax=Colletotrichum scovillei TaxID=1209932 RepID=A0A9P7QV22_9PEZI|nr:drug resistance transporter EmrB/QacA subfamily [Colletotrichum scovillei]KAG7042007.1 drug resistance transporter EmrB/QacA subfamily [Colletotrichum scovillei]KAG7062038.1 drug resistance transporter EmrB/QacA subfamily [Colletotrichum scovillei]
MTMGLFHGYLEPASSKPKTRRIDAASSTAAPTKSSLAIAAPLNLSRMLGWFTPRPWCGKLDGKRNARRAVAKAPVGALPWTINENKRGASDDIAPFVGRNQFRVDHVDHGIYARRSDSLKGTEDDTALPNGQRQENDEFSAQHVTELGEYDEKSWPVVDKKSDMHNLEVQVLAKAAEETEPALHTRI